MRVLLVPSKSNYPNPEPQTSLGLGQGMPYLAGALKAKGHDVFGANVSYLWCHGSAPLTLEKVLQKAIAKYRPQLIGVGGLASDYFFVRDAIFFCRKIAPDVPIVAGGGIFTHDAQYIFSHLHPDYAIIGEGEAALVELVQYLEKGRSLESVSNLAFWNNGKAVFNEVRYPECLDELPFPDYSPFDFETYLSLYSQTNSSYIYGRNCPRPLPITIGRSCPFRCTFCSKSSEYRTRSIDDVIKEIGYFYEKYHFNTLNITDELFSDKGGKAREFCVKVKELKKSLKADFDWDCFMRVNDVNKDLLREMKDSGCVSILYGFESGSDAVLKSMKKGITAGQMVNAIQWTQEVGVGIQGNIIFGDVAETPETIEETVRFFQQHCKDHCVDFAYITPYPGSELFRFCLDSGLIKDRKLFYETVLHAHGSINMTRMPDDVFYKLTKPFMLSAYNSKAADVVSCEKNDAVNCDCNAPFELRRSFYKIRARCPFCGAENEHVYPLRINREELAKPFVQHCFNCHKRISVDISQRILPQVQDEDPYAAFYQQKPYLDFYPFDVSRHPMQFAPAPLLLESYKNFNIVRYADCIYGIAQALGELDVAKLEKDRIREYQRVGSWFVGDSVDQIKKHINEKRCRVL